MVSRFAANVRRSGERVVNFLFGWYKLAVVLGLLYGLALWGTGLIFPNLQRVVIQLGLMALIVLAAIIVGLPVFWAVFRNRIARKKSLNPNIAVIEDEINLRFLDNDEVEFERRLVLSALVTGVSHAQFQMSWAGKASDVVLIEASGADVRFHSPPTQAGLRVTLGFGRSLAKGRRKKHFVSYKLRFSDAEHLIRPFNGFTSVYAAEEKLTLGYAVAGLQLAKFRRACFSSLTSETPVLFEEHDETEGSHRWEILSPVHGYRYNLSCLTHAR